MICYTTDVVKCYIYLGVVMSIPVRISEEIYNDAKRAARTEFRSIPHQIELWAELEKCALDNPDLPVEFIRELLISKHTNKSLAEPFNFKKDSE